MAEATTVAEVSTKAEDLTGMGIPVSEFEDSIQPAETEAKTKAESKAADEAKPKEETKVDVKEEVKAEDNRPARSERLSRALFTQIKELRDEIKSLKSSPAKEEAKQVIDKLTDIASRRQLDAEGLKEIGEAIREQVFNELEKSGKFNKDLPTEITEKLKLLDTIQADRKVQEEVLHFEKEWQSLTPELQKQYPNAKATELSEAKKLLDELGHSKEFHDKDLDYVVYKNRSKFDALLKVAKNTKSGETTSKQIEDYNDDEDIDLDPENMTPDKMKAYQKRKMNAKE